MKLIHKSMLESRYDTLAFPMDYPFNPEMNPRYLTYEVNPPSYAVV